MCQVVHDDYDDDEGWKSKRGVDSTFAVYTGDSNAILILSTPTHLFIEVSLFLTILYARHLTYAFGFYLTRGGCRRHELFFFWTLFFGLFRSVRLILKFLGRFNWLAMRLVGRKGRNLEGCMPGRHGTIQRHVSSHTISLRSLSWQIAISMLKFPLLSIRLVCEYAAEYSCE